MIDEKKLIEELEKKPFIHGRYDHKNGNIDFISGIETWHETVMHEIENAPKVGEWIPCSERLPNCNGCYLVWRPHFFGGEIGMPAICYFDGQNTWHDSYGVDFTRILNESDVVAWQPLPEPYKGE